MAADGGTERSKAALAEAEGRGLECCAARGGARGGARGLPRAAEPGGMARAVVAEGRGQGLRAANENRGSRQV